MDDITQDDRELMADLFDLPPDMRRKLIYCEHDGNASIYGKLCRIADFRRAAITAATGEG